MKANIELAQKTIQTLYQTYDSADELLAFLDIVRGLVSLQKAAKQQTQRRHEYR